MLAKFHSLQELKVPLAGQLRGTGAGAFNQVATDSRMLNEGDLFLAIRGEKYDGHDFISHASAKGAAAFIVSREISSTKPSLLVEDTKLALGRLGALNRLQWPGTLIAVTGSNGKTTIKEMIGAILVRQGKTLITAANENNNFGVPMTLLRLNETYEYAVIEIGADRPGEIDYSAQLAKPQLALLTNVHKSHLSGFGTLDKVAEEKGRLINYIVANGTVILGGDSEYAQLWERQAKNKKILFFAAAREDADIRLSDFRQETLGIRFQLSLGGGAGAEFFLPLLGKHNAVNAAAACAVGWTLGVKTSLMQAVLAEFKPPSGRLSRHPLGNGCLLIDDSYNANPASCEAALRMLSDLPWEGGRIAILADMLELGEKEEEEHRRLGKLAGELRLDGLLTCGRLASLIAKNSGNLPLCKVFRDRKSLISYLDKQKLANMVFVVKGSRGMGMEEVVNFLCHKLGED